MENTEEISKEIIRTYELKDFANLNKLDKVLNIFYPYRKCAKSVASVQWKLFYSEGKNFNKQLDIKEIDTVLSERYKQTCQYQVVGMLNSYLSNVKTRFVSVVLNSSVNEDTRIKLLYINKYNKWFKKEVTMKKKLIEESILKLARRIFKQLTKNKPSCDNINLTLDSKVGKISVSENEESNFDYWIKISTLEGGKPVSIPLKGYKYFYDVGGLLKNTIQVNLRNGRPKFSLVKSINFDSDYVANECCKLGLDVGTVNVFATSEGDLLGIKLMDHLKKMDKIITKLEKNLKKQNIKPSESKRFVKLNRKVKEYIKNEINRILNKLVKRYKPKEIHVEKLDFKGSNIGKTNNRILNRFGKSQINKKLDSLSESKGIIIERKNPAYTSQECSNCHYTNKTNRKSRNKFECGNCGLKLHADVNGGRNTLARSSRFNAMSVKQVFQELGKMHDEWKDQRGYSSTKECGCIRKSPNLGVNGT